MLPECGLPNLNSSNIIHRLNKRIMNKFKISFTVILATVLLMIACKKNELRQSPFDLIDGKALVKINYSCPYISRTTPLPAITNRSVWIRINGKVVSSGITYSTPYPGGGLNTGGNSFADYLSTTPGVNNISIVMLHQDPTKLGQDSVVLYAADIDLKADTYQTIHFTDTSVNTKHIITYDPYDKPDSGWVLYKFVNLIPNAGPLDLYHGTNKIASNIDFGEVSDTFRLQAGVIGNWTLRKKDGTVTLGSQYAGAASSVANQRVFTIYARGYDGLPTTDVRNPRVSLLYNR